MPLFCDVALPVPLDTAFTYRIPDNEQAAVGARVLVPFRQRKLSGVVTRLHDDAPGLEIKNLAAVLDRTPVLSAELLALGKWISDYYLAPIGEVLRTMLPLGAEFKREIGYRITDEGERALHMAGMSGSPTRARKTPEEQYAEFRVLDYLLSHDVIRDQALRSITRVSKPVLTAMVRKKWIAAEDLSGTRNTTRRAKFAILRHAEAKLNSNQRTLIEALAAAGGEVSLELLRELAVPRTTLGRLVKRGLVEIAERVLEPARHASKVQPMPVDFALNADQERALDRILASVAAATFSPLLLHGVTGSGKTAVYLAAMRSVLEARKSAILLVPEIGLTPAVAAELYRVFGEQVAILHSGFSDRERAEQWHRIKHGGVQIVVGTRSAVFAPVEKLALVIVDEEQDSSYKQEETPRYHARDVAVMRAKMTNAVVVLGSATPSLESYFNAKGKRYGLLELPDRVEQRPLPAVEIVDMRQEFQETGHEQVVSRKLVSEIKARLERREQVIILLNRRGYSPLALCRACGKTMQCRNCAIAMTHHKGSRRMKCHYCGFTAPVPSICPECGSEYLYFLGTGTEKLEELLHSMFPQARMRRLDRDTVRSHADFERTLNALNAGEVDILLGTQMIAKGHDVHGVTLVGVIGADAALGFPDFRSAERTFQLLAQVAGRAGRGQTPGRVILQTYFQDHYAVQCAAQHDFVSFYEKELRFRSWMHYPPFSALANVVIHSGKLDEALRWSGELGRWFESTRHEGVRVLGPAAAPIVRMKRDYRYHFVLKAASREKLNALLRSMLAYAAECKIPRTQVIVDVDALWLM